MSNPNLYNLKYKNFKKNKFKIMVYEENYEMLKMSNFSNFYIVIYLHILSYHQYKIYLNLITTFSHKIILAMDTPM